MKTIKKSAVWFLGELKWYVEIIILHLRAFSKENEEMFSHDNSKLKNFSYRLVFSIGLGVILSTWGFYCVKAVAVVRDEAPFTKEYLGAKLMTKQVRTFVNPVKLLGNSEELESIMQETHIPTEEPASVDEEDNSIIVEMSAYTSREAETDSSPCISADGSNICNYDGCVVASNDFDLGSKVEVEGFGDCIVKDRMNRRYSFSKTGKYNMDMYMRYDLDKALKFGRQQVNIKIK